MNIARLMSAAAVAVSLTGAGQANAAGFDPLVRY